MQQQMRESFINNYFTINKLQRLVEAIEEEENNSLLYLVYSYDFNELDDNQLDDNKIIYNRFHFIKNVLPNMCICKQLESIVVTKSTLVTNQMIYDNILQKFLIKIRTEILQGKTIASSIEFTDSKNVETTVTIVPKLSEPTIDRIMINNEPILIENGIINAADKQILKRVFNNILLSKFKYSSIQTLNNMLMTSLLIANCDNLNDFKFLFLKRDIDLFLDPVKCNFEFEQTDYCVIGFDISMKHSLAYLKYNNQLFRFNSNIITNFNIQILKPGFIELNNNKSLQAMDVCPLYSIASSLVLKELTKRGADLMLYSSSEVLNVLVLDKLNTMFLPIIIKSINESLEDLNTDNPYLLFNNLELLYYNLHCFNLENDYIDQKRVNVPFLRKNNTLINKYKKLQPNVYIAETGSPFIKQTFIKDTITTQNAEGINIKKHVVLEPMQTIIQRKIKEFNFQDLITKTIMNSDLSYYTRTVLIEDEHEQTNLVLLVESVDHKYLININEVYILFKQDLQNIETAPIDINFKNVILKERNTFNEYSELYENVKSVKIVLEKIKKRFIHNAIWCNTTNLLFQEFEIVFPKITNENYL